MKRTFYILLVICMAALPSVGLAQSIPNGDFENWSTGTGAESPDHWHTNASDSTVFKSTDAHSGHYSLYLKPINDRPSKYEFAGASTSFGIHSRPELFNGYYKTTLDVLDLMDSLMVGVLLYALNDTGGYSIVGYGHNDTLSPAGTFTAFSIPITYLSADMPDSAVIAIVAYMNDTTTGRDAYFDALTFSSPLGTTEKAVVRESAVYPNPVTSYASIIWHNAVPGAVQVILMDAAGRSVKTLYSGIADAGDMRIAIDLSDIPEGIYLLEITAVEGRKVHRVIKN
ncbi:MAG: T9SS type A sorting domain-containing protein [Bacteroidota bacterium]|nr:T9SS type A sorting domain-containing protein [Bacteroidota bacterium]